MSAVKALFPLLLWHTNAALDVSAPSPQRALFTKDTVLICNFSVEKQPLDLNLLVVSWTFQGKVILKYDKGFVSQDPRMSLNVESLDHGNASLYVSSVTISDRGTYVCTVKYSTESKEKEISFKVFARPLLSIQSMKVQRNTENTLTCKATGFFPPDILITWYRKGEVLTNHFMGNPQMYNDGTYQVDSNVTITPTKDDQNQTFSCRVQHDSLQEPLQEDFQLIYEDIETSSNVITVVSIILVLMTIIGVGIGIYFWRRKCRKRDYQSFMVNDIESPVWIDGEKTTLNCEAFNCTGDIKVTWIIKLRDGTQHEVSNMGSNDKEEEQALMSREYEVTKECDSQKKGHETTNLTFIPSISRHLGSTVSCRIVHQKKTVEKTFEVKSIYEAPTFVLSNIQGPQIWFSGEKVTLYCSASYCMEGTQVIWMVKSAGVTISEIGEDGADVNRDSHRSSGYVAHREKTEESDKEGLQDVTSSLTFTPSISKHQNISITCKILCDGKVKEKTFQHKHLYAKPTVSGPIKLSLTDSGEVLCSLDIEGFYPSDIQMKWNDKTSEPNRTSQNSDGTYSVHSEYKLPENFFSLPDSVVRVSWKHDSMEDWESREMSVLDKEFPWKANVQDIKVPNLLIGREAVLKCEVSNVFPDVLSVKWLKKEKGGQDLLPVVNSQTYSISELRPEKQKNKTFTYKLCLKFKPSDEGAEFICRVEHPTLEEPTEKSTGPLTIKDEESFIVGEIQGPRRWIHGEKVTLYCSVSDCSEDTQVMWMVEPTDGRVEEISNTGRDSLKDSGYMISKETEKSDKEGLLNIISSLTLVPSVSKHVEVIFTCKITSEGQTKTKKFQAKSICAKPQVMEPVKTSLNDGGDVPCSLNLQNFYPKDLRLIWSSGEDQMKSKEEFEKNSDHTYSVYSHCTVPGKLLLNPNFTLHVTWSHSSLEKEQSQVLSWRDPGLSWCPVIEEVPIPHVLIERWNTLQYNISGYFPDDVTVSWYRKEKGTQEYVPLSHSEKYQIPDIQSQRQSDLTYSCTARLLFKPNVADGESEIMCSVSHPSLERPIERGSGPLQVQDFPWRPQLEISVPPLRSSEEAIIQCTVTKYFPDAVNVLWFRKDKQSGEMYPVSSDGMYRITNTLLGRQNDKSYESRSCVTFSPSLERDHGVEYICRVEHPSLEKPIETSTGALQVTAKPKAREPIRALLGTREVIFSYMLENFYPKDIQVKWCYWSGEKLEERCPSKEKYTPNLMKTFSVSSEFTIPENLLHHSDFRVRFTWRHESMDEEEYKEFSIRDKDFPWRPRLEISVPPLRSSEEAIIQCTVTKYFPDVVNVLWFRKDKQSGEMYPVSSDGMYRITNMLLGRQNDKSYGCRSCVTFSPSLERDHGMEYICRVEHPSLEKPIETSTGALKVTAKPKAREPIRALLGTREVIFSYMLENFYPKDIQVKWCYWSGEKLEERCPSKEKYTPNLMKTFSVSSEFTIPENLLHHSDFRVRFTWRHESMDEEEYKEFSIRDKDFPWRPRLKISVPPLRSSEEAIIQCTVTKYFPDAVNVLWFRKDKQSGEMYPVSSDGMYRITNTLLGRQNDKSYGCISSVTFSPSLERDQGVEYICRVEHPSLEKPIETSTGALQVTGPD